MKVRKIPMRSCVVTHEKLEKRDLIRVVKNKDGEVFVDESGKANGRGAYLKKSIDVIEKAKKNKILDKILDVTIKEEVYDELLNIIK